MTPDDVARDGLGDRTTVRLPPDQWDHWYRTGHPTVNSRKESDLFYGHVASEVGMRAVDLACGNGQWTRQLTSWGLTVRGFDFAPEALKQAAAAGSRKRPHVRALGHRRRALWNVT
ncbi:methyltransferase domain-containing protein [Streptomyces sp. S1D4-11]|nr:class I SAM-dependent methyltransferase [Streptomyces sp. S1D4-11]QIY93061.1 class I SAM-dependent methyltransferase [Streptomyces sp. S1D4-11]